LRGITITEALVRRGALGTGAGTSRDDTADHDGNGGQ
jgi:hypothetical protein